MKYKYISNPSMDFIRLLGYYLRWCFILAFMHRIFMCGIFFFFDLFAYVIFFVYLCTRKG